MNHRSEALPALFDRAVAGDRRALGRLLSHVEAGSTGADQVTELAHGLAGNAHVVGITGAPGSGKSTLTGQLTRLLPELGLTPAVLAVDPSSPLSGGAILGDRIRMDDISGEATFIRSMATRGHSGGLALAVPGAVRLFDAVGYDPVIIETVGVGQVEVEVTAAADTTVVVVTPGWGDAVQANKAGLLEVANVFVVNKADRPDAEDARRDLDRMLDLSHMTGQEDASGYRPPIIMCTAIDGDGTSDVWAAIDAHIEHLRCTDSLVSRRGARLALEVRNRVARLLGQASAAALQTDAGKAVLAQASARSLSPSEAANQLAASVLRP